MFCLSLLIKTARECINIGPIKSNFQIFFCCCNCLKNVTKQAVKLRLPQKQEQFLQLKFDLRMWKPNVNLPTSLSLSFLLTGWQWAIKANYGSGRQRVGEKARVRLSLVTYSREALPNPNQLYCFGVEEEEAVKKAPVSRLHGSEEERKGERAILNRDTFPLSPSPSPSRSLVAAPQSRAEEGESTITAECRTRIGWRKKEKNEVTARRLHSIRQRTSEMNQIGGDIRKAQRLISLKSSKKLKCRLVNRILVQLLTF